MTKSTKDNLDWIARFIANKVEIDLRLSSGKIVFLFVLEFLLFFSVPQDYVRYNYLTPNEPNVQFDPVVGFDGNSSFIPVHVSNGQKENDNITIEIKTCYFNKSFSIQHLNPGEEYEYPIYHNRTTELLAPYFRTQICNSNYDPLEDAILCPNALDVWRDPSGELHGKSNGCPYLICGTCNGSILFYSTQLPQGLLVKNFTWKNVPLNSGFIPINLTIVDSQIN
jgi:hypothetical protein